MSSGPTRRSRQMSAQAWALGSNHMNRSTSMLGELGRKKRLLYSTSPARKMMKPAFLLLPSAEYVKEEVRIREELAREVEEELERELMEGILVLVRRLSHLKAEQIARGINTARKHSSVSQMKEVKPYLVMIFVQANWAALYLLSKAAFGAGLSTFVFTFYRQAIASLVLIPVALVLERKHILQLSFEILGKNFLLAFIGITLPLNLYGPAVNYTSANLVAAASNVIPVTAFLFAVLFRLETVNLRRFTGKAKLLGVLATSFGVIVLAFYKGPSLTSTKTVHIFSQKKNTISHHSTKDQSLGTLMIILCNSFWSLWIVLQGIMLKSYPSNLLFTTMQAIFSSIQLFFVTLIFERNFEKWKPGLGVQLITVLYAGVIIAGLIYYLQTWCVDKKGPVFSAMFFPLSLMLTTVGSAFLFGELIDLGSVISAALMVVGLYSVLWAKRREVMDKKPMGEEVGECKDVSKEATDPEI